jgi:hypothetical protein
VLLLAPTIKEVAMRERKEISKEETVMIECIQISQKDVAHRAHELYVQRGSGPGKDVEDWVRAEKELGTEVIVGPMRAMAARSGRNLN